MHRKKSRVSEDLPGKSLGQIQHVKPKKRLGQHFLRRKSIALRIVGSLEATKGDTVIEVGAGTGELTRSIVKQAGKVVAAEIDKTCLPSLKLLADLYPNLEIFPRDVRNLSLNRFGKVLILGNLPYHLSGEILFWLLGQRKYWCRAVLTVQAEFADRLTAPVGTHHYSALSVISQTFFSTEKLFDIPSDAFVPPPRISSATIRITPLDKVVLPAGEREFIDFVKTCFTHRRKTLVNNLKIMDVAHRIESLKKLLEKMGYSPKSRPQELSSRDYINLIELTF